MSKYSYTWLGRQYKWLKYTPFANTPLGALLLRNYTSGSPGYTGMLDSAASYLNSSGLFSGAKGYGTYLGSVLSNLGNALNQLLTGDSLENLIKSLTHSGITDEARETMDLQLENQQLLNQQEYDRKIDFYERFESPEAQVRQYKEAGLNPMLLAGSGAGASASGGVGSAGSAGTAGSSGGNLLTAIASIAGIMNQQKALQIQEQDANTRLYDAETRRQQSVDYMAYLRSLTRNTDTRTDQLIELFPSTKLGVERQASYYLELCKSEAGRRALMASQVNINEAEEAIKWRQEAILAAQEDNADAYFKATAELQEAYADLARTQSNFERRTLEKRIEGLNYQVSELLFEAALKSKVFSNFNAAQIREWINTGSRVVGTLGGIAVGAGVAGGLGRASYMSVPFSQTFSQSDPYANGFNYSPGF